MAIIFLKCLDMFGDFTFYLLIISGILDIMELYAMREEYYCNFRFWLRSWDSQIVWLCK